MPAIGARHHVRKSRVPFIMKTKSELRRARHIVGLAVWLAGGLMLAGLYAWAEASAILNLAPGWAVKPGLAVLVGLICLAAVELKTVELAKVFEVVCWFVAALLLAFLSLPRRVDCFVGIGLSLLGMATLFNSAPRIRIPEVLLLVATSYIQSVFIYNIICGGQMMFFFKPGWTT